MTSRSPLRSVLALLIAILMLGLAVPSQAAPPSGAGSSTKSAAKKSMANPPAKPLTVMTRNIYLGGDIDRPVRAALAAAADQGASPETIVAALAAGTDQTRTIVDATDFPTRAGLLAAEIKRTAPDLVGLQEVALWRSGPLELTKVGIPNATTVDYDFLQLLLDELNSERPLYSAAVIGERADVESPSFTVGPTGQLSGRMQDVRLTVHDVILIRNSGSLTVRDQHDKIFEENLELEVAGVSFDFDRGYVWVDVRSGAQSLRFVNTHLEAFSSDIALAQASEMVDFATAADTSTVIACDCNSDPLNDTTKPQDSVPHKEPYELITQTYTDQWLRWAPAEEGWTSGLNERVNEFPPTWTHRIDMIFGRTAAGAPLGVDRGEITGGEPGDRDAVSSLWPSDHAGVVLRLRGL